MNISSKKKVSKSPKIVTVSQSASKLTLGGSGPVIEVWGTNTGKYG